MKKIIFLLFCCFVGLTSNAQWRKQYLPGDELKRIPAEWSYSYEIEDKSITFTESGMLMIVAKNKTFLTDKNGNVLAFIGLYMNGVLIDRCSYSLLITPDGHAAGGNGFKDYLKSVKTGATVRVVALIDGDFDFDLTTTKMNEVKGEMQRVIFNL